MVQRKLLEVDMIHRKASRITQDDNSQELESMGSIVPALRSPLFMFMKLNDF